MSGNTFMKKFQKPSVECSGPEAVNNPYFIPGCTVAVPNIFQDAQLACGLERAVPPSPSWYDGAVDRPHGRRTTPDHITVSSNLKQ